MHQVKLVTGKRCIIVHYTWSVSGQIIICLSCHLQHQEASGGEAAQEEKEEGFTGRELRSAEEQSQDSEPGHAGHVLWCQPPPV